MVATGVLSTTLIGSIVGCFRAVSLWRLNDERRTELWGVSGLE